MGHFTEKHKLIDFSYVEVSWKEKLMPCMHLVGREKWNVERGRLWKEEYLEGVILTLPLNCQG